MSIFLKLATGFLSLILIISAIGHIINPELYAGFIPEFLPATPVNIASAIVEFVLGVGLLFQQYRRIAFLGVFILMLAFLPIHSFDLFREEPVIGTMTAAIIRVIVQFGLIGMAWWGWKQSGEREKEVG